MDFNSINLNSINTKKSAEIERIPKKDIAIIGIHAKLPQISSLDELWEKLKVNVDFMREFPESRKRDSKAFIRMFGIEEENLEYCEAAYLDEIDKFDYGFFRISPKEASLMDPVQRLFLETAWNAVEDAGYGGEKLVGSRTGVFVGFGGWPIYGQMACRVDNTMSYMTAPGTLASIIPSRIAYLMDFRGPAMLVDTACSASLVAVHLACKSIRSGECDTAIVGSININYMPLKVKSKDGLGIESSSGRAKTFDESSDGTGWGEGIIAVVLKPLDRAVRDRDNIYAVIKGSAINQDGSSIGITAPNAKAQEDVILKAWEDSGIDPETISYIEAHGTGTKLGDPVEIEGIQRAYRVHTNKRQFCAVGSVKANLGHLADSAGLMGLLKTALVLKNREIPPLLHFKSPNRKIDFIQSPVYINEKPINWVTQEFPMRCGVSSFGLSGTNCHVVMEEAPHVANTRQEQTQRLEVLALSAKTDNSLLELVRKYRELAEKGPRKNMGDICYSANTGRGHYCHRLALILKDWDDLRHKMDMVLTYGLKCIPSESIFYNEYRDNATNMVSRQHVTDEIVEEKRSIERETKYKINQYLSSTTKDKELLAEICSLYVNGVKIEWEDLYSPERFYKVSVPVYPFERKRCWVDWDYSDKDIWTGSLPSRKPEGNKVKGLDSIISGIDVSKFEKMEFNIIEEKVVGIYREEIGSIGTYLMEHIKNYPIEETKDIFSSSGKIEEMKEYMQILLLKAFQDMGAMTDESDVYIKDELIAKLGVTDKYVRLFEAMLDILSRGGFIEESNGIIRCRLKVSDININKKIRSLDEMRERLYKEAPAIKNYISILNDCVKSCKEVISGKIPGTEVLFPKGSTNTIDSIYKDESNKESNELISEYIRRYLEISANQNQKNRKIRILEVGAGVGVATAYVLEAIKGYGANIEYCYTDISKALIDYGEKTFGAKYPFVEFKRLNIEKDAERQGFDLCSFDVVLAVNVIHATRNVSRTVKRIKKLLRKNGLLFLLEGTCRQDFATLTFGLLDGWWLSEDMDMRIKYSPMLTGDAWKAVLFEIGFNNVGVFGIRQNDISLIAGESNGIVELDISIEHIFKEQEKGEENQTEIESVLGSEEYSSSAISNILRACREVLGHEKVSPTDNFYELGGDSILAIKIISSINESLNIKAQVVELLKYPELKDFGTYIEEKYLGNGHGEDKYKPILPLENREYYEVSSAQKRIYIDTQIQANPVNYNIPWAVLLEGTLEKNKIEEIFLQLIKRHETLRTSMHIIDGEPVQKIHDNIAFDMEYEEIDGDVFEYDGNTLNPQAKKIIDSFIRPFDLAKAPLIHVRLVRFSENKHILMFDMHHLISDAGSMGILIRELQLFYNGYELPELKVQYKDFAKWHNELLNSDDLKKQEKYWLDKFSGNIPKLNLPTDYPRAQIRSFEGDSVSIILDSELDEKLNVLSLETGITLYMVLLSGFSILLAKYTGQEDIIIGSGATSRSHKDAEGIIGVFVNSFATRNFPESNKTFMEFLLEVRKDTLDIYENQDYQFEMLIEKLNLERDLTRHPLYDIVFALNKSDSTSLDMGNLKVTPIALEKIARLDLALYVNKGDSTTEIIFEYCKKLFYKETIKKMAADYINILEQVCSEPNVEICKIDMMSKEERQIKLSQMNQYIEKIRRKEKNLEIEFNF